MVALPIPVFSALRPIPPVMEYPEDDNDSGPFAFSTVIYLIALVVLILTFFVLYYVIYTYLVRSEPYYYTVPDPTDRNARVLRRVVPFREWFRRFLNRPRSQSDEFRERDFERVQASLVARGWRGHVFSDGNPDLSYLRMPAYDDDEDTEARAARRAAWVERPDTKFWQEQAKLHPRDRLFGPTLPNDMNGYNTFARMDQPAATANVPGNLGGGGSGFFRADVDIPDAESSRFHVQSDHHSHHHHHHNRHEREDSAIGSFGDDEEDYFTEDDEEERERQNQIFNYYQTYAAAFSYQPSPTEVMKTPFSTRE